MGLLGECPLLHIYISPPAFPLYIPGSFSQSTHRTVDTHIVIYCFSCCYLPSPLLLCTRIVISLLVRRAFSRMKLVYYHPCDCGRSATSHAGLPKNHIIVISIVPPPSNSFFFVDQDDVLALSSAHHGRKEFSQRRTKKRAPPNRETYIIYLEFVTLKGHWKDKALLYSSRADQKGLGL